MKAAIYTRYGPPEVVQICEVERPLPNDDEVLIRVHVSTVNRTDCGFRSSEYFISRLFTGLFRPRRHILGCEFSGTIEAAGKNVIEFHPGQRVFGFDDRNLGGHAEYMVLGQDAALATIPTGMGFEEAAALCEGAHYALCDLRAARVKSGTRILINGGTGAIGSAAIQLAKYLGAHVTTVCHADHVEKVRALGPDEVIDYTKQDFTTMNHAFDFVFDAVGKSSFGRCRRILHKKGIYISTELGRFSQNIFLALFTPWLGGRKVLFPIPTTRKEDILLLRELAERGLFKPLIDRTYPLEQIVEAYRYVETGQKIGNVLIRVKEE